MRRTVIALAAAVLLSTVSAHADSASANLKVSVQVVARANVTIVSQVAEVTVSEADVVRGFVELTSPIVVHAQTNSRHGYLLQVSSSSTAFASIQLTVGDTVMTVVEQSWLSRPYVPGGEFVSFFARLRLSPGSVAGHYTLPLAVSATPL